MKKIKIEISGMHCASCASNVERSLKKVAGVKNVNVSLLLKKAMIECEENTDEQELTKAVKKPGYNVSKIIRE